MCFGYILTKMFSKILLDITTSTTEEHYIIRINTGTIHRVRDTPFLESEFDQSTYSYILKTSVDNTSSLGHFPGFLLEGRCTLYKYEGIADT